MVGLHFQKVPRLLRRMRPVILVAISTTACGQWLYRIEELAYTNPQAPTVWPQDINDWGQIAGGSAWLDMRGHATIWTTPNSIQRLEPLLPNVYQSEAYGINNLGHVAATAHFTVPPGGVNAVATLWTPEQGFQLAGVLPTGGPQSVVGGVTDLDEIYGYSGFSNHMEAFIWDVQRGMIGLGDLPGGQYASGVMCANNVGQFGGGSIGEWGDYQGVIWDRDGNMFVLPDLTGDVIVAGGVSGINDLGQCVGAAFTAEENLPYLWDPQNGYTLLPLPEGCTGGFAVDINNRGEVIGWSWYRDTWGSHWCESWIWDAQHGTRAIRERLDPCKRALQDDVYINFVAVRNMNNIGQIAANNLYVISTGARLTPYIAADTDLDGDTDLTDLAVLLTWYGSAGGVTYTQGDVDEDGDVDVTDLAHVLRNFGARCP